MKKQICGLFMHSFSSLSIALRHTHASHAHTHVHTHSGMHKFVSRTLWNAPIFWALFFIPKTFCSWLCLLVLSWEDALTFRSTIPLQSLEGTFSLLLRGWRVRGQFWVAVLSDTEGLKKTELEILKNLEHMEMSHSHREEHTLGNFLPCLTVNIQK